MLAPSVTGLFGLFLVAGSSVTGVASPPVPETAGWEAMLTAVNETRASGAVCGGRWYPPVGPLTWDPRLERAAEEHAHDMSRNGHFDHYGTDGRDPGQRARLAGYNWWAVGENIARRQSSVDQVMEDWLESPGHCRQLLSPTYLELGAAEVDGYWAQVFGSARR